MPISDAGYVLTAVACCQVPYWMMQAAFMQKGDECTRVSLLRLSFIMVCPKEIASGLYAFLNNWVVSKLLLNKKQVVNNVVAGL